MARKILADYMFRFRSVFATNLSEQDLDTLMQLPDGELQIDILTGGCTHSLLGNVETDIANIMRDWFTFHLQRLEISHDVVESADLFVILDDLFRATSHNINCTDNWVSRSILRKEDGGLYTATY